MNFKLHTNPTLAASATRMLPNRWDFVAFPLIFCAIAMAASGLHQTWAPMSTLHDHSVSLDPANLPEQSLRTVPRDLTEVSRGFHLTGWQRFWKLEVPFSMPGLVWNMMMSMSGGWFFVVASEAITVGNNTIVLPGVGAYLAQAIGQKNL